MTALSTLLSGLQAVLNVGEFTVVIYFLNSISLCSSMYSFLSMPPWITWSLDLLYVLYRAKSRSHSITNRPLRRRVADATIRYYCLNQFVTRRFLLTCWIPNRSTLTSFHCFDVKRTCYGGDDCNPIAETMQRLFSDLRENMLHLLHQSQYGHFITYKKSPVISWIRCLWRSWNEHRLQTHIIQSLILIGKSSHMLFLIRAISNILTMLLIAL